MRIGPGGPSGSGGLGGPGANVVSLDDMHSANICFLWSKPLDYWEKLRCHACNGHTDGRMESSALICLSRIRNINKWSQLFFLQINIFSHDTSRWQSLVGPRRSTKLSLRWRDLLRAKCQFPLWDQIWQTTSRSWEESNQMQPFWQISNKRTAFSAAVACDGYWPSWFWKFNSSAIFFSTILFPSKASEKVPNLVTNVSQVKEYWVSNQEKFSGAWNFLISV